MIVVVVGIFAFILGWLCARICMMLDEKIDEKIRGL